MRRDRATDSTTNSKGNSMTKKRGGKREGAGRPADRGERKINTGLRLTPTLRAYLQQHEKTQADLVEDVVRRTADFKRWESDD